MPNCRADKFFNDRPGIHKLSVVDDEDRLRGLFTMSDIERISQERNAQYQARAGCALPPALSGRAVSATRNAFGELDRERILAPRRRPGGTMVWTRWRSRRRTATAKALATPCGCCATLSPPCPSSPATCRAPRGSSFSRTPAPTRLKSARDPVRYARPASWAGVGIPQLTALFLSSRAARKKRVTLLADGGITQIGDIVKALTLAEAVIWRRHPGRLSGGAGRGDGKSAASFYKQYRGMGSLAAMKAGVRRRVTAIPRTRSRKVAPEGVEALKEVSGSVGSRPRATDRGHSIGHGLSRRCQPVPIARESPFLIRVSPAGNGKHAPARLCGVEDRRLLKLESHHSIARIGNTANGPRPDHRCKRGRISRSGRLWSSLWVGPRNCASRSSV